jgi:zinc transport system substrate-binding protein
LRTILNVLLIAVLVLAIVLLINHANNPVIGTKKIKIVTTLYPLFDFVKKIGQDKVEVMLILPPSVSPHNFEPKPSDIVRINQADIFIYTGRFMEPWAEKIINGLENKKLSVIDSSIGIKMIPSVFHDEDEPIGSIDPHIWLDVDNDKSIIQTITQAIVDKDKVNADFYQKNADIYKGDLRDIDNKYIKTLSNCKSHEIIYAGHYAFGYMAARYNLKYLAAQGVSPDAEPTAKDLIHLIKQIKKDKIKNIFYDKLSDGINLAKTLSKETHTGLISLNSAHNISKSDYLDKQTSFLSIMQDNLVNLKIGLECSE